MTQDDQVFNDLSEGHFNSYYNAVVALAVEAGFNASLSNITNSILKTITTMV